MEAVARRHRPGGRARGPAGLLGSGVPGVHPVPPRLAADRAPPPPARAARDLRGPILGSEGLGRLPGGEPPAARGPPRRRASGSWRFLRGGEADRYDERRDMVADDATSHLSAYLRLGMCTSAQVGRALGLPGTLGAGREAFWRQVAWREFFHHHLVRHPEVARAALREDLRGVAWEDDPAGVRAWAAGETGFPLVDAGMRQLAQTGWMHNRARIVTASFLVKDLLVDWRVGETALHAPPGGRRSRQQQRRMAVDGGHRHRRGALLPRAQPGAPGRALRPGGRVRPALGARAARASRTRASTSPGG